MITAGLRGVEFVVANTDAQALTMSKSERLIQLGAHVTEGLGAGSQPEVGRAAAEECIDEIIDHLSNTHMCFVTAGMGGGTGTGAAPVVARAAREKGILTVGVVTKPFHFEGQRRMKTADLGIEELQKCVDTLIVIPNQNLFRLANDKTTFADAFAMADQVLYSGVACITDLMVKEGLINLDFADVRSVMREMGKAMMGTGEASGEGRAMAAAEAAIANPLLDETSMRGAKGLLISITGGRDLTLFEVDEAATRIREEVDQDANIILGATFDEELEGVIRVSVVATGIDKTAAEIAAAPIAIRQAPPKQAAASRRCWRSASGRGAAARDPEAPRRTRVRPIRSPKPSVRPRSTPRRWPRRPAQPPQADDFRPAQQAVPGSRLGAAAGPAERAAGGSHAAAPARAARRCRPAAHAARRGLPADGEGRGRGQEPPGRPREQRPDGLAQAPDQRPDPPRGRAGPACSRPSRASRSCASRRRKPAASPARTRSSTRRAAASSTSTAGWRLRRGRLRKTTSWRFRRSFAGKQTERPKHRQTAVRRAGFQHLPAGLKKPVNSAGYDFVKYRVCRNTE